MLFRRETCDPLRNNVLRVKYIKELFRKLPTVRGNMFLLSINLKTLNEHVQYHFKMDTLQSEKELLQGIS